MLKLGYDSVSGTSVIQSAAYPTLYIPSSSNVGIGTSTPAAKLEIIPTSGYSILAGNFKIGNVAMPTADADAATKGYVDSVISSATSSLESFWGGTATGNIWSLNSGNVGIGTTTPTSRLHVYGTTDFTATLATPSQAYSPALLFTNQTDSFIENINGGAFQLTDVNGNKYYSVSTAAVHTFDSPLNSPAMTISAGNVGIGTSTPLAKLEIIPTSGYSILAGNFKIGHVASPTVDSDAATKGYIDSAIAAATSSITGLPTGSSGQTLRYDGASWTANSVLYNNGVNIGIGTTTPNNLIQVYDLIDFDNIEYNTKIGYQSGKNIVSGAVSNTYIGYQAGLSSATLGTSLADHNIGIGHQALYVNTTGYANVAIGTSALSRNTTGYHNFGIGYLAMSVNTTGYRNFALGSFALNSNITGNYNVAIGNYALLRSTLSYNIAIGGAAGQLISGGGNNTTSANSIFLGYDTRPLADGDTNEIVIGHLAIGAGSNSVMLGNSSVTKTVLNGNVGVGTSTPNAKLEVIPASGYSILAGNYKIGNVASPTADSDVVTMGWVNSALSSVSAAAVYSTSTPATYAGSQSGYSGANALCAAVVAGTHACTTGEIFNTINTGAGATIPSGTTLWVSNGPPGYTANANDCMGWTSAVAGNYGTVWVKLATGDGFGSLNVCNTARSFACCQ
jgi:hypothetical protein